jgi:hypothetical protein
MTIRCDVIGGDNIWCVRFGTVAGVSLVPLLAR